MEPRIMRLTDITSKEVEGHEGFVDRSLFSLPEKEIVARLLDCAPGSKGPVPPHSHPETHFFIVLKGHLELEVDGTIHSVPDGHCAEVPPDCVHQLRCTDEAPMRILAVKWK